MALDKGDLLAKIGTDGYPLVPSEEEGVHWEIHALGPAFEGARPLIDIETRRKLFQGNDDEWNSHSVYQLVLLRRMG